MSRHVQLHEWSLTADSISRYESDERQAQQRLFRVGQSLLQNNHDLAKRYVENGAPLDMPLIFDEAKGGVPGAIGLLPGILMPESVDGKSSPPPQPITLLAMAAAINDMDSVRWLLRQGANIDMVTRGGRDAAWFAIEHGANDVFEFLMGRGALVGLRLTDGSLRTRLIAAVLVKNENMVRDLIRRKCDLNAYDRAGKTALHHNLLQDPYTDEDVSIARLLLDKGASPNFEDNDGIPAHALARLDVQQALMTGYRLAQITQEARKKLDAPKEDLSLPDPATDPGLPQVKRPRPARPRL